MKIILAPDSYKGSISSIDICKIMERELRKNINNIDVISLPMADGGENSLEAIMSVLNGEVYYENVFTSDKKKIISTPYGISDNIGIIEIAKCCSMELLKKLDPLNTNTYGVGQLIKAAINKGIKEIILCLGGSSSTDGGLGMMEGLGIKFYDKNNNFISPCGRNLIDIMKYDDSELIDLKDIKFTIFSDVKNILYGKNGSAYIYGRQKGTDKNQIIELDNGLRHIAKLIDEQTSKIEGSGAVGDLGYSALYFFNSTVKSGSEAILDLYSFNDKVKDADYIITGEGKLDKQSFQGKVLSGILNKSCEKRIISICGSYDDKAKEKCIKEMIKVFPLSQYGKFEDTFKNPKKYLVLAMKDVISYISENSYE